MNWIVGTTVSTSKGDATVTEITDTEAVLTMKDGTTKRIPYRATNETPSNGKGRQARVRAPKAPKPPKAPKIPKAPKVSKMLIKKQEREDKKIQKQLDKVNALLDQAITEKNRIDALKNM